MIASTFLSIYYIPVLYVVIRSLFPGRAHRDRRDEASGPSPAVTGILVILGLSIAAPAFAQAPVVETVTFDEAISRALAKNPTVAIAATNILRSEALLQQVRSFTLPRVSVSANNVTRDTGVEFGGQVVQPQNQTLIAASASAPVLAAAQWAARTQAMDQVEIARLSEADTRRQIAVATGFAYLEVIAQKRQVEVATTALDTARQQVDYNRRRREGGVGSRLNELRSVQLLDSTQARLDALALNVRRAQEALGVLIAAAGPVDVAGEPVFDVPPPASEEEWLPNRPDVRLFTAEREANQRIVDDSRKDWWPLVNVSFDPQLITPAGVFAPSRTWRFTINAFQPLYDAGERRAARRLREAALQSSTLSLTQLQIQARSEVRVAREAVSYLERAFASARQSAQTANEVLKITIIAFDAGSTTNIEVIDAQRAARDQEAVAALAEDAVRQARLELLVALGLFPR
jgi:outer membrane protein TolC